MVYSNKNPRESLISSASSLSKESDDNSYLSIIFPKTKLKLNSFESDTDKNHEEISLNNQSLKKINCSEQFLFFGPLVLCIILLISGIILFILVGQKHNKHEKEENIPNKLIHPFDTILNGLLYCNDYMPISCPSAEEHHVEAFVAHVILNCGLHRSSLIHLYYSNYIHPIKLNESVIINDVTVPPDVQLNFDLLSKMNYNSFILILIDHTNLLKNQFNIRLHWIRYFSLFIQNGHDICHYTDIEYDTTYNQRKTVLLYATNVSQMMIIAKTTCQIKSNWFRLSDYITFIKLKLIATTYFIIPRRGKEKD